MHLFLLLSLIGNSQVDFTSMGFTQSSSIGELNVSVGQINYTNDSNAKGDINLGVQQTYLVGVKNIAEEQDILVWIFPNPTSTTVKVHIPPKVVNSSEQIKFTLYDAAGRLVRYEEITSEETLISMETYAQGNYVLNVVDRDKTLGSFKIIRL